ncbi:MAG: hypothetical protein RMM53_04970 [Bacteroidia bacterium]|nr:hypothetical protein [Bacteroidia bacterium]
MSLENKVILGDMWKLTETLASETIDLIVCDGPYGITDNDWDKISNIQNYNLKLIRMFSRILKPGGSISVRQT